MPTSTFLDTALELLSHAIDAEKRHENTEAYTRYMSALDYLMAAQQSETNEKSKTFLKTKADEYLSKAEALRQRIDVETYKQPDELSVEVGRASTQSVILNEAFKCAKQAIDADTSQNYAEAYKQYMKSMDYFMFAQRYEPNEQLTTLILSEVKEYLSRAETIRKHLDSLKDATSTDNAALVNGSPRTPEAVFLHTAIEITQQAVQQDVKKNYRAAYELYNGAFDYFLLAHKYEKNEQPRVAIRTSLEGYLARAEVLKKCI